MKVRIINDKNIWERFVLASKPNIFLQSWNWGEFHQSLGKKIFRLGFWEGKKLIGVALLIKEPARRGTYLTCPGGPLFNWSQKEPFETFISEIRRIGRQEKAVFIRVRPSFASSDPAARYFKKAGFVKAPMHLHAETTLCLDLNQSEEEILAGMRKNTRYSIRRAAREGVKTEISHDLDDVDKLYQLQMEVVRRRGFVPFSLRFFRKHFQAFLADNQIVLIKAVYQQEVLSIGMFIYYGDTAFYHYSGSSIKHPQVCASYAMLWEAIKEAQRRGCQRFDFWGIAPTDNPHHRFAGVTLFKKGFGGKMVAWLPAQDLPLKPNYWLTYFFETSRRLLRHL